MPNSLTRRQALRMAGVGSAGVIVLAACGEAKPATVVTAVTTAATAQPAATEAPKAAATAAVAAPKAGSVQVRLVSDHTSGPRGAAMQWGLAEYAKRMPQILVKFEPQPADFIESFSIQMAAGTQAEVALLGDGVLGSFVAQGGFVKINDLLGKRPDWKKDDYYFTPDVMTVNYDHNRSLGKPAPTIIEGPQYGAPFQGAIAGLLINVTLSEKFGIPFPPDDKSWTYDGTFLEAAKKATSPDKSTWGTWARQDFEFQWSEMCYGWGAKNLRDVNDSELTIFDNGGDQGLQFGVDLIHKHKVSFPIEDTKRITGEFGDPFSAGQVWGWLSGRVYSSGFAVPRIKDRFKWSLAPMPRGPVGTPQHEYEDQPHLITNGATRRGNVEQAVDLALFLAGPVFQGRVSIDRGHLPVFKDVLTKPEAITPPPEGMKWLKVYADTPDHVHRMMMIPSTDEFFKFRTPIDKAYAGESKAAQAIEEAKKLGRQIMADQKIQMNKDRQALGFPPVP